MKEETKNYLEKELTSGLLGVNILKVSDEEFKKYHGKADDIVHHVRVNDKKLYDEMINLMWGLRLEGLWRGWDFAFCKILYFILMYDVIR